MESAVGIGKLFMSVKLCHWRMSVGILIDSYGIRSLYESLKGQRRHDAGMKKNSFCDANTSFKYKRIVLICIVRALRVDSQLSA